MDVILNVKDDVKYDEQFEVKVEKKKTRGQETSWVDLSRQDLKFEVQNQIQDEEGRLQEKQRTHEMIEARINGYLPHEIRQPCLA